MTILTNRREREAASVPLRTRAGRQFDLLARSTRGGRGASESAVPGRSLTVSSAEHTEQQYWLRDIQDVSVAGTDNGPHVSARQSFIEKQGM